MSESGDDSQSTAVPKFPIKLVMHRNTYANTLFDVDGNVLVGDSGFNLNVFREEMKDMMISKKVRCIHYMTKEPTYCYFITDQEQMDRFQRHRDNGSQYPEMNYHVYPDP
jgi:hypothetical protein